MSDKIILECWCIFATKLKVFTNKVEVGKVFGLSTTTIPMKKIAAVHSGISGVSLETSGGLKISGIAPWKMKYSELADLINKQLEEN